MMENIKINITSNGTTTLATAGKYCERNVDIDVLVAGGGGSSLLDSEGSLFMTADEEAFCVDGNDRMVDVTEFPKKPLDNVVYRKNEKTTTSDGQLTYINETTSYGIPVQTDHSNGLHYKNVDVLQYMGEEKKPQAFIFYQGNTIDFITWYSTLFNNIYRGYKIANISSEWDRTDTEYVYLLRYSSEIAAYGNNDWVLSPSEIINDPSEIGNVQEVTFYIFFGKGGWQSIIQAKEESEKYYETVQVLNSLLGGYITNIESDASTIAEYAFYNCTRLETAKFPNSTSVSSGAFYNCRSLKTIILNVSALNSIIHNTPSLQCLVLLNSTVCWIPTGVITDIINSSCFHFYGTVDTDYNPNGAKDGYIYVPLSLIDQYKSSTDWNAMASQIMPYCKTFSEIFNLDTTKYTHAFYDEKEWVYNGTQWYEYTR